MQVPFKVICINDSNRPAEIPIPLWVKKNERYTVIKIIKTMDNKMGFILEELTLGEDTFPYDSFNPLRFIAAEKTEEEKAEVCVNNLMEELCLTEK
jgi:hypothetical protein